VSENPFLQKGNPGAYIQPVFNWHKSCHKTKICSIFFFFVFSDSLSDADRFFKNEYHLFHSQISVFVSV